jgi:hypothetical protein
VTTIDFVNTQFMSFGGDAHMKRPFTRDTHCLLCDIVRMAGST